MAALIGYDMCHYAILKEDPIEKLKQAAYGVPVRVVGAITANINPNASDDTLFADNGPMESSSTLGKIELELGCADFPLEIQAELLGHEMVGGMLVRKATDSAPFVAVGGRSLKSNGKYRYFWLLKGKMSEPEQKRETKKDKVEYQTPTLKGSFLKRDNDELWIVEYDEDCADFDQSIVDAWFTKVMGPMDIPLTVSMVNNGATNIPVDGSLEIKFSKEVTEEKVNATNIKLETKAGLAADATVTIGADKKTVKIKPNTSLTASTEYKLTVKVDTGIKTEKVFTFTTAGV